MNAALKTVELAYRGVNRMRRALYRSGILKAKKLSRPVISVGNIVAGGAGKTPAVIAIARHLVAQGLRVAVLTRGYGRAGSGGLVTDPDPARFGDEPVLIKKYIANADVIVGTNRYENGVLVSCDVYLLDDGFQHLQLHRDLDVVIAAPPGGFHREGLSALRDADIVLERRLRVSGLERLAGKSVVAFAGLADNEQFFDMLRNAGVRLVAAVGFPDHHRYTVSDLDALRRMGGDLLVTTEKDAVKTGDRDIIAIAVEFEIDPDVLERIAAVARG